MDFVVLGFGTGALAVLVGLLLAGDSPRWLARPGRDRVALEALAPIRRTAGWRVGVGGGLVLLATLLALLLGAGDGTGALVVAAGIVVVGTWWLIWGVRSAGCCLPRRTPRVTGASAGDESPSVAAVLLDGGGDAATEVQIAGSAVAEPAASEVVSVVDRRQAAPIGEGNGDAAGEAVPRSPNGSDRENGCGATSAGRRSARPRTGPSRRLRLPRVRRLAPALVGTTTVGDRAGENGHRASTPSTRAGTVPRRAARPRRPRRLTAWTRGDQPPSPVPAPPVAVEAAAGRANGGSP